MYIYNICRVFYTRPMVKITVIFSIDTVCCNTFCTNLIDEVCDEEDKGQDCCGQGSVPHIVGRIGYSTIDSSWKRFSRSKMPVSSLNNTNSRNNR